MDETVGCAGLYDFYLKCATKWPYRIKRHDHPIYLYRQHSGQLSQGKLLAQSELDNRTKVVKRAFERLGIPYPANATGFRVQEQKAYGL